MPIVDGDHLTLRATAHFMTRTFIAGEYQVSVGLNQALLHLDHPSYELEQGYQATLPKETWSQSWINKSTSEAGFKLGAKISSTFGSVLNVFGRGNVGAQTQQTLEQKAHAPYPLVSMTPVGWRIGTESGDPRAPEKTQPNGLEHCLDGEYLTGRRNEQGDGYKEKNGKVALCILKPKAGGNDPHVTATLVGVSSALRVAVTLADPMNSSAAGLKSISEGKKKEKELREAFIAICLRRADEASKEHPGADAILSGEFFLDEHRTSPPKLSPEEIKPVAKPKGKGDE